MYSSFSFQVFPFSDLKILTRMTTPFQLHSGHHPPATAEHTEHGEEVDLLTKLTIHHGYKSFRQNEFGPFMHTNIARVTT